MKINKLNTAQYCTAFRVKINCIN